MRDQGLGLPLWVWVYFYVQVNAASAQRLENSQLWSLQAEDSQEPANGGNEADCGDAGDTNGNGTACEDDKAAGDEAQVNSRG